MIAHDPSRENPITLQASECPVNDDSPGPRGPGSRVDDTRQGDVTIAVSVEDDAGPVVLIDQSIAKSGRREEPTVDNASHKQRVQAQFGAAAEYYVRSVSHATGDDLQQLVAWAEGGPERIALDVATGAGHTALALAPLYGRVIATDLTDRMLATAQAFIQSRGVANVEFRRADAEDLPFPDETFDTVSCRIAPHHFTNVARFVAEVARVLRPGGVFLLEDSVAPEDPALAEFLNDAERLRDATHVQSLRVGDWHRLLTDADLAVEAEYLFPKTHAFASWVERARTPEASRRKLEQTFRDAPPAARAAFAIVVDANGQVVSYSDQKLALKARKQR